MARFDVHRSRDDRSLILDVQADLLEALNTCVVVPLFPMNAAPLPAKGLNPVFRIEGQDYVLMTQFMAAVPKGLQAQYVTNLSDRQDDIVTALDRLLIGF